MNKKVISLMLLSIFILSIMISSVQGMGTLEKETNIQNIKYVKYQKNDILKSTTIETITTIIEEDLNKMQFSSSIKYLMNIFLDKGINEIKKIGINSDKSLLEMQGLFNNKLSLKGLFENHRFLLNFYPDTVEIETTLPINIRNISSGNQTLETFIKLIPLVDSIKTTKQMIIRKFIQETSILWPAIGAQIKQDNKTIFIIAFGPGIKWDWRLFLY